MSDDVAFADATELQRLLTAKTVSSVELTELYLKRLETYGPVYNGVVTILHERARREAKRADAERARGRVRGPLHGIPYGVKDLLATPDAPTTWGAQPYREQRFDFDATVVKKLSAAGAVLLAKLAMVELAGGFGYNDADASFTGPGRTPWNWRYWSGGSSSGSGIAVSAGLVGFAIGSETSGSILFPSTACGVTGLRPTYGRVSRHGAMALCWSLDKLGPLARSARDAETILRAIAGADPLDPTAVDAPFAPRAPAHAHRRAERCDQRRDAASRGELSRVAEGARRVRRRRGRGRAAERPVGAGGRRHRQRGRRRGVSRPHRVGHAPASCATRTTSSAATSRMRRRRSTTSTRNGSARSSTRRSSARWKATTRSCRRRSRR